MKAGPARARFCFRSFLVYFAVSLESAGGCAELESAAGLAGLVDAGASAGALEDMADVDESAGALADTGGGDTSAGTLEDAVDAGTSAGEPEDVVGAEVIAGALEDTAGAGLDGDSLAELREPSVEPSLEEAVVEAELRTDFLLATGFAGAFALGAIASCGWGVLGLIASSACATTVLCPEFVAATFEGGVVGVSAALLTVDGAGRITVSGVDQTWSSTNAPPIATTTIVPNAIGKWFTESSCPWLCQGLDRVGVGRVALPRRESDEAYRRASERPTVMRRGFLHGHAGHTA